MQFSLTTLISGPETLTAVHVHVHVAARTIDFLEAHKNPDHTAKWLVLFSST